MLIHRRQQGVSLVESMIALLVISVGLLGIAALQITAMKQNTSAFNHSQAVWIGANMADRIRANISQFSNYDGISTDTEYDQNCNGVNCSPAEMIDADAAEWALLVKNLPAGKGTINGNAAEIIIKVMWDDEGTGATGETCSGAADQMTCYTVTLVQ